MGFEVVINDQLFFKTIKGNLEHIKNLEEQNQINKENRNEGRSEGKEEQAADSNDDSGESRNDKETIPEEDYTRTTRSQN